MIPKIKIMRDYQCHPIWLSESEKYRNINPNELSLSPEIIQRLTSWSQAYQNNINLEDPYDIFNVPVKSDAMLKAEEYEGLQIWIVIRTELTKKYEVEYFFQGKLLSDPSSHPLF